MPAWGVSPRATPERDRLLRRASWASVSVAVGLVLAKAAAVWATQSAAVLGTLLDSAVDVMASLVSFVAIRQSLVPPDPEHRFGHGKAEQLAALMQGVFIVGSGMFLAVQSAQRLADPHPIQAVAFGAATMVLSLVLTAALVLYQRSVVRRTGSTAIMADSLHYTGDFALHVSVLAGLLSWWWLGWPWVDGALGIGIAAWLVASGVRVGWIATEALMDRELPDGERDLILAQVRTHPEVLGCHGLRTRLSGSKRIIQIHLVLDGELSLNEAHRIAVEVEHEVMRALPGSEVLIHQDPAGLDENEHERREERRMDA